MSVSYDEFTKVFLGKTTAYDLYPLDNPTRGAIVDGYMKRAVAQFKKVNKYDLNHGDDDNRIFDTNISEADKDELIDIITEGMLVQWMKPYVYTSENLENLINTNDYSQYSPAELLLRIKGAYKDCQKDFDNMIKEYSFNHGDLTKLHT